MCLIDAWSSIRFAAERQEPGLLSWMATGSYRHREYSCQFGNLFAVFEAVREDTQRQCLSTPPQKLGADNQAAWESWHLAITLAADFVDQLNG